MSWPLLSLHEQKLPPYMHPARVADGGHTQAQVGVVAHPAGTGEHEREPPPDPAVPGT